ncbi:prepilin-type N-terminal cleavage/methylation domain-containing protein [Geobacter sp. OR-1]|uniref:type IV pilus modification PilV family protein n=1 Tax=Geobacter sp. OR-1 TaxID=1266765 RepID=UPI000694BED5|nr:prepilin-type N-terminal cleavage/methylation domain-containing protein [Geobacter sp. OR-1]
MSSDNQSGFTLIEFCVAVLIMMVGLLGLLQAVNMATEKNLTNILRNEAVSVADNQMVQTKASVVDTATFNTLANMSSLVSTRIRSGSKSYSVTRNVTAASSNSKEVVVAVSWQHKGNTFRHLISSMVVNPNN